eukprot:3946862-Ditylum_brightwellii.AAC.1
MTIIIIALTIRLDGPIVKYLDNPDQDPEIVIVKEILSPTKEEIAIAIIVKMMNFPIKITTCIGIWNSSRMINHHRPDSPSGRGNAGPCWEPPPPKPQDNQDDHMDKDRKKNKIETTTTITDHNSMAKVTTVIILLLIMIVGITNMMINPIIQTRMIHNWCYNYHTMNI